MNDTDNTHTFPITISKDLSLALLEQASAKRQTINQLLETVLRNHLAACNSANNPPIYRNYFDDDDEDYFDPYNDDFTDAY